MDEYQKKVNEIKYEVISETPDGKVRQLYWNIAIGLQDVDHLKPSKHLLYLAKENINGNISYSDVQNEIKKYYDSQSETNLMEKEADEVSVRIVKLLNDKTFRFDYNTLRLYHKFLFSDIDIGINPEMIGNYRTTNITKNEPILNMDTVLYADYNMIVDYLSYDFEEEKNKDYTKMSPYQIVDNLAEFTSRIWQVHPFREGNTRTTAVFIQKYIMYLGLGDMNNEIFKDNSDYFRNALVRANYANYSLGVKEDQTFLKNFFSNLILHTNHKLIVDDLKINPVEKRVNIKDRINSTKEKQSQLPSPTQSLDKDLTKGKSH